ncbi:hypothetical protein GCM10008090_00010 [Arenicella chitinivorans]|uniref:Uncharacterized protein n=2 Tax=Arenicella chitinivorans TaxID=1329800 RepID=A0A918RGK0_9GAMM|nr:hypothetical protein GCM10008090_00010 [Arenicella chitinivorans]
MVTECDAQVMEEIAVTSPRLSYSGDRNDFRRYINSIDTSPRPGDGISGDIEEQERLCEAHYKKERAKCEEQAIAGTVGRVETECVPYLSHPNVETTFEISVPGASGTTRITATTGIQLYDACVGRANMREQAVLKVCENIERNADCEFN